MRRFWTLAALPAVALCVGASTARAAHIDPSDVRTPVDAASAVTGLSLVPGQGQAEVVIALSGPVAVQDFTVPTPHRIVLDLTGARLGSLGTGYDRVARGGITNIRTSQYRVDVVRVVLDVDGPRAYTVTRGDGEVRIAIKGDASFAAWHSSGALLAESIAPSAPTPAAPRAEEKVTTEVSAGAVEKSDAAPATQDDTTSAVEAAIARAASQARAEPRAEPRAERAAPADTESARPAQPAARAQQRPAQQPRITVTWSDADIRDVLAGFATFSGRTLVVGKEVTGTVTAEIKDQPWDVALKAILEAQGLAASEDPSGIITVDSYKNILEKQSSEPVTTQMVNINYVAATSLVSTVQGLLYKECPIGASTGGGNPGQGGAAGMNSGCIIRGTVAADSGTNSLIITEVTSRLPDLLQYVKGLDVRTPQVALKAKIISVSRTQIEQLGLSYDLGSSGTFFNTLLPRIPEGQTSPGTFDSRVELGGDALAGVSNATRKYKQGSALNLIFSTALGKYSLTSFLDALRETQLSDIQAEPSIVTLDNRQARMFVGQETPVRVIDAGSIAQIGAPARANVQFRETGIILTVTPHITNNRQIRMTMEAEQSDLNIVGGDLGFIINKRNAKTQLLVNNGETAVIGGLTQTQVNKNKSGIPILSELPLIGRLFSQTETREEKKDLLILITPHIIDEGEAVRPPDGSSK
ncbi:MAG: AMIN domain-containing protein [Gemmatimonadaceae bacterium]|nr:AMIN domain-containing protein [Gemmatimonadaceae bacterium]